ncbi:MAG: PilZ domain-containing protein, partial [Nitrospinota bacterium]
SQTRTLQYYFAYSSVALVTGGFVAYRLDSPGNIAGRKLLSFRIGAPLLQGGVTSLVVFFAFLHTENRGEFMLGNLSPQKQGTLFVYTVVSFCIGVGINLAARFRRLEERRETNRTGAKGAVKVAAGGVECDGSFINISPGGAAVRLPSALPLNVDSPLEIFFGNATSRATLVANQSGKTLRMKFDRLLTGDEILNAHIVTVR